MFHFTRRERSVLIFLLTTFILGSGIRVWQRYYRPLPEIVYKTEARDPVIKPDTVEIAEKKITININHATQDQLIELPGIGPVLAQRIVDDRQKNGPFKTLAELKRVSGIGSKKQTSISKYLIIE